MKIRSFNQIEKQTLYTIDFDIIITASGYEGRATYIAQRLKQNQAKKIVFSFSDNVDKHNRIINDEKFKELCYEPIKIKGSCYETIIEVLNCSIVESEKKELLILVDYSSMTRIWYGSIIHFFSTKNFIDKNIKVYFAYSGSCYYSAPEIEPESINFSPIDFFCHLSIPSIPTALIIGLGNEKKRAYGLREYFDAEALYVFYSDNNDFTKQVIKKNQEVLKSVIDENIYAYNINELIFTKTILEDLCKDLLHNFRIIIAPCGPKPFTFLSFIVASLYNNIDVWRISASDENDKIIDKPANDMVLTIEIDYQ